MRLIACCAWLIASVLLAGCGSNTPFELVPVHGKVTYEDGSLIQADSVQVGFIPADVQSGPITAPGGRTTLNMADGTFAAVTSMRRDDGVVAGRHKVTVVSFKKNANGDPRPTKVVPEKYNKESTTPLEVTVDTADQFIEIKVSKK
jgi:hypothetical protein